MIVIIIEGLDGVYWLENKGVTKCMHRTAPYHTR